MIVHLGSLLDHSDPQSPHLQGGDNKTKYTDCHEDGMGQYMQSSCPVASTLQTMAAALPALVPARHRHSRLRHSRSSAGCSPTPRPSLSSMPFSPGPWHLCPSPPVLPNPGPCPGLCLVAHFKLPLPPHAGRSRSWSSLDLLGSG